MARSIGRGKCCWVLVNNSYVNGIVVPGKQCGADTRFKIKSDDDDNRHRVYEPFCPEHTKKAKEQEEQDENS